MAAEQAGLLQHHGYTAEAEQTFRLATEMAPANPEAVFRLINLLAAQGRFEEAIPVAEAAVRASSEKEPQFAKLLEELNGLKKR